MLIKKNKGCYNEIITIDDVDINKLNSEELDIVIKKIIDRYDKIEIIKTFIDDFGIQDWDDEPCDQCGDYSCETTLEI